MGCPGHIIWGLGHPSGRKGLEGLGPNTRLLSPVLIGWKERKFQETKDQCVVLVPFFFLFLEHLALGFKVLLPKAKEVGGAESWKSPCDFEVRK